jgi:UDP-N-acetylmuramoyl-tripeptide--D-alanyl-D-alanine ligase
MNIEELYQIYIQFPNIQTDTRKIKTGDIYIALKGENFNGNHFAEQAIKLGASYCIIDEVNYQFSEQCIVVHNALKTLQELAAYHRKQFSIPFIAITGSNGKTTTKELMLVVLSSIYKTYATEGNLNNHIGVPLTILKIRQDAEMVIIEMGANHQKEIESYCLIAQPTHAIINNCGKAHLEGFGGIEGVRKGKGELYDYIRQVHGIIFRNADLDYLNEMANGIMQQITYGANTAMYQGRSMLNESFLQVAIMNANNECVIQTQLVGEYNFANVLAAVAVGRTFSISMNTIKEAIQNYSPSNSRSQLIKQGTNTFILDAYNANPSSMQLAIQNFVAQNFANKVVMLGAMKELGIDSIKEHQAIIEQLQQTNWNEVVLVGGDFENIPHTYIFFKHSTEAQIWFRTQQFEQTAFLIKGSRAFTMEKIIQTD